MQSDTLNILTRKAKGRSHQQTVLSINWEGMDQERLAILARTAIIYALQCRWKKDPLAVIPEKHDVRAVDFIKGELHEVLIDRPPVPKRIAWLDELVAGLSEEEKIKMMEGLTG